jgi:hypothetical protein
VRQGGVVGAGAVLLIAGLATITFGSVSFGRDRTIPHAFGHPGEPQVIAGIGMAATPASSMTAAVDAGEVARPGVTPSPSSKVVPVAPTKLTLPTLSIIADVEPVHTTQGALDVPTDVSHVGWWAQSMPAGARFGTTVIDGHIDSAK